MAIYMTFGCPLYALTCAQFAGSVLSYAIELRQAKLLREPIEEAEFIFAANILSESSDTLQMGGERSRERMGIKYDENRGIEIVE